MKFEEPYQVLDNHLLNCVSLLKFPISMKQERYFYLVLAITLVVLLFNLNSWGVLEASEARYAEISREMFRSGNLLQPTLLNIWHFHKPPVTFWLTDLGFQLFRVNAFGARFMLQLSLILQGVLIYLISQQLFGVKIRSILATMIYLSFPLSLVSTRNLTTDSFLTTLVLGVIYGMTVYYCQRQIWGIYGTALMIGIGFLTKGPAIFVVPFGYWCYLIFAHQVKYQIPIKHLIISLLLCVTLGLSWYVLVAQKMPSLTDYFLGRQLADRVLDANTFDRTKPAWFYPLVFSTTTLPWLPIYLASFFPSGDQRPKNIVLQSLYWLLLPFVVFSLTSSKLIMYLLPMYPGLAMLVAGVISEMNDHKLKRLTRILMGFYWLLGAIALFVPFFVSVSGTKLIVTWQMVVAAILVFAVPVLIHKLVKQDLGLQLSAIALFSVLAFFIYGGYLIGANELSFGGTRPLAKFIQTQGLENEHILVYNRLLPSLAFNLDRDIITLNNGGVERETQFQTNDDWKRFWLDLREPAEEKRLTKLVQTPSVLLARETLPDEWHWIQSNYSHSKSLDKWTIYYSPVS
jgi:4-amino-4-deoxy-L-arabinose transferase-like glycosyltransferase